MYTYKSRHICGKTKSKLLKGDILKAVIRNELARLNISKGHLEVFNVRTRELLYVPAYKVVDFYL